jgi:Mg2+ transporter MgtE
VPGDKLSELHPADLADIISDMNRLQTSQFINTLNLEQLVDTLEEVEEDFQVSLVEAMPDEKVADVLGVMAPDEAADLLAELPRERSDRLMELMEEDEVEDVRKLLAYPEESAGGIMTTEYISIFPSLNAEEAIQTLREIGKEAELIYYVYVTDTEGHLEGVFSLSDLILAKPGTSVTEFMHTRMVTANLLDSQEDVAQQIAKYNLLGIPVVDEENILHGVVTADDALDKIIPTAWKKRLPHYYR